MTIRFFFWLFFALTLGSCGIESVQTLNPPSKVSYSGQTNLLKLTFQHVASDYTGTSFQGYEVYYRVYPVTTTFDVQLTADIATLNSGPVSTLTAMGYSLLSQSSSEEATTVTEPILIGNLADNDTISLDFTKFADASNLSSLKIQPEITVNSSLRTYAYRSTALNVGVSYRQNFGSLRTDTSVWADTAALSALSPKQYQIEVFIAAYGLDTNIAQVRSKPVAWGEINYVVGP